MRHTKLIDYDTIVAAANGDAEAMNRIMSHYAAYIQHFSKRPYYDEYGDCKEYVDEEIKQQIEVKLMMQIVCKFDYHSLPDGETLEP